jgi:MFS family permease
MQILSWGSTFYLLPVLAKPIVQDTGWPYDRVMAGVALGLLVAGSVSPRVGRAINAYGGRLVLASGSAAVASGLCIVGLAASFPIYLVGWAVLGAGMGAALYDAAFSTLGAIYGKTARGAITSVTLFGGFASTVCWPLSAFLVGHAGWRAACFTYAGLHIAIGVTLALFVIPSRQLEAAATGQAEAGGAHLARDERAIFILLATVLTLSAAILSLVGTQLVTLLLASGLTLAQAVGLGMIIGPAAVGARFVEMLAGARYHPFWTQAASTTLVFCGALLFFAGPAAFAVAIAVYAAGNGIGSIAKGTVPLALFGAARYPLLMGRIGLPVLCAMSLAPYLGAVSFQHGGAGATFSLVLGIATVNAALVAALALLTKERRGRGI